MALAAETKRITAQFDYSDADVNKGVLEFLKQMSKPPSYRPRLPVIASADPALLPLDEGLEKDGTSMSQIPTYVTGVPNGTEKVRAAPSRGAQAVSADRFS